MRTRSTVWKLLLAMVPAAGIVVAQTQMDDDWFSSRTVDTVALANYWNMEGSGSAVLGSVNLVSTNGVTYLSGRYGFKAASVGSQKWFKTSSDIVLSNTFTVCFWLRRVHAAHAGQATYGMPIGGLTTASGYLNVTTNALRFFNDGETKSIDAPYVFPSNVWTHVAITCGSNLAVYVNGSRIVQSNYTSPFVVTWQMVGNGYVTPADNGQRYVFRGDMDEFRRYDVQKSSGEVYRIYSEAFP